MHNWLGLAAGFGFIFALIGIAQFLWRIGAVASTTSRKIVHIGVAHWWLIAMYFHDSAVYASVGPIVFIALNYYSHRTRLFEAMEDAAARGNLGTVYFPVSLLVLVMLSFGGGMPTYAAGIGVLTMGYGDGLASVVGRAVSRPAVTLFGGNKSLAGTATMFVASALVAGVFTYLAHPMRGGVLASVLWPAVVTGGVATAVELFTPGGTDNLSVPLLTALFYTGVFA
ncbi:MAG: diacylglycerol/polyprenol kinase family protein [Spirochaetaceae bacterium]